MRVFLEEISFWLSGLSKEDPPSPVWVGIKQSTEDWNRITFEERVNLFSLLEQGYKSFPVLRHQNRWFLGYVCVCVCVCARACVLSRVLLFVTPRTIAHQAPLSMKFSGKIAGAGCHFLVQEIFPTHGSSLCLLCFLHWQSNSLPLSHHGNPFGT